MRVQIHIVHQVLIVMQVIQVAVIVQMVQVQVEM